MTESKTPVAPDAPPLLGETLWQNLPYDALSGFLVFLIAMPLCLAISSACGYPPLAGVFTAIAGGILVPLFSNSELTIKGPAAGLIAVAISCVQAFGYVQGGDAETNFQAYRLALGVGVAAGILQIAFALLRAGKLGDFFPTSTVHGMLAAIGIIIISKQIHILLGVKPAATETLHVMAEIPHSLLHANWAIGTIGLCSLVIMFGWQFISHPLVKLIPAPLVVLLVAVPMGLYFDLEHAHKLSWLGGSFNVGPNFLVDVETAPFSAFKAITFPDFSGVWTWTGLQYILMFSLVGSLETLLSAQAIDQIDPWRRKTDLNRDLLMVGVVNTLVALIGGLPMISEIVRSKANIDAGARTRISNVCHGIYLLVFVSFLPFLIHEIPVTALAAMLIFTGFRLASPQEFVKTFLIGKEQLAIFLVTIFTTLASDLLIGIAAGVATKLAIHLWNGVPLRSLFLPIIDVARIDDTTFCIEARDSAVFTNWLLLKEQLLELGLVQQNNLVVDMSDTVYVDHTVMENLHHLQRDFENHGLTLTIVGFDDHESLSEHEHAARRKPRERLKVGS